jgi:acyl transferase domain-containing protein/acyl carrier protein
MSNQELIESNQDIAIIGMAGRFPGAKDIEQFWDNLHNGVESISMFSNQELEDELEQDIAQNPNYVKARAILADVDLFDASFFGFNPREAEIMDPQQRLFVECAWSALEYAGYDAEKYSGAIGVFASTQMSSYLLFNLYPNRDVIQSAGLLGVRLANDRDFLATRVSYKLNLRGPSLCIQTACSSSLVACHLACQSLIDYQCDMALAGGVSIHVPQKSGYLYQLGGIYSPDGHCRAFDAQARGTVSGNGLGIVVLKRLEDALADGDTIHAVIKGSAINNDGFLKVGYTAPSVKGQAEVITAAQAIASVEPDSISYIEAHGTATELGDPVEIAALTQAFRLSTNNKGFCAIGSVKTNIGHLDAAAGVASLIKTVLALKHKQIPPSLHWSEANPEIDFSNTPFYVNTKLTEWKTNGTRRAGVSSFGVGGTNAHVVLSEAPIQRASSKSRSYQILTLSAKTENSLNRATEQLAAHLQQNPNTKLADVAFTLNVGRKDFEHRRMLVCKDLEDAVTNLEGNSQRVFSGFHKSGEQPVAFMFPGQGAQYVNMGLELYQTEATFRREVDSCAELLKPHLGLDLRTILYPNENQVKFATQQLEQTFFTQPALFVVEYALAKQWMEWGVQPQMMIGHSIGEYVAACLAGVFSLSEALILVANRGRLMQSMPSGSMLAVYLDESSVTPLLGEKLSLATVNAPSLCVVAGPTLAIEELQTLLAAKGIDGRRLHTSHAFHSAMMEPILKAFSSQVQQVRPRPPQIPFVSNVTGTWITAAEATNPEYWVKHLRSCVRFSDGITKLQQKSNCILLEVGPGRSLSTLARQHSHISKQSIILTSLRHPKEQQSDLEFVLNTLGKLWLAGASVNWAAFYADEQRQRLPLPTYPFERQRYWIEAPSYQRTQSSDAKEELKQDEELKKDVEENKYVRPHLHNTYTAPTTTTEHEIIKVWEELLGITPIGINDNFFELGGHSLLATQVLSRIRERLGVEISPNGLLTAATVAELALQIEIQLPKKNVIIPQVSRLFELPLSLMQQRLWFLQQVNPINTAYNLPVAVRLEGILNLGILEQSFNEIFRRHELLRSRLITINGEPKQEITPVSNLTLPVVSLETEAEVQLFITEQVQQPFDLSWELVRINILRLSEREHIVLLIMHHIISDGWSMGIFIRELSILYEAFSKGLPSPLPELSIQYADFANWQRQWLQEEVLTKQLLYWKKQLTGATPLLKLPASRSRPSVQSYQGASYQFGLSKELTQGLNQLSQKENATLYMTLLAAFMTLLYRYSNQEDIVVGSPIANRDRVEFEGLIGPFLNTLPLRADLSGDPSFRELLLRVREVTLSAYDHKDIPLEKLVQELGLERNLSYSPLFQVWFALQNLPKTVVELSDLTLKALEVANGTVQFDLELFVYEETESLSACFNYSTGLFDATTIYQMASDLEILLMEIILNPDTRLKVLVEKLTEIARQKQIKEAREFQKYDRELLKNMKLSRRNYNHDKTKY